MRPLITAQQLRREVPGGIGTYVRGLFRGLEATGVSGLAWLSAGDEMRGDSYVKTYDVPMMAGRRYIIDLQSDVDAFRNH